MIFIFSRFASSLVCQRYAVLKEAHSKSSTVCGGEQRTKNIYISDTNIVQVEIIPSRSDGSTTEFLLSYSGMDLILFFFSNSIILLVMNRWQFITQHPPRKWAQEKPKDFLSTTKTRSTMVEIKRNTQSLRQQQYLSAWTSPIRNYMLFLWEWMGAFKKE